MKIAIIGATGHAGSLILNEAMERQIDVTAIVRDPNKLVADVPFITKDLFDLTQEDLAGFDVVIDAFRPSNGKEEMHQTSLEHLIAILAGTSTRLLVVGGASSLYLDEKRTTRMIDISDPKAPYYPTAYNMYQGFLTLTKAKNLHWSYLSPAANFVPDGKRTGRYQLSDDLLKKNHAGQSEISMADYAIAMVDEALHNQFNNQQFSVVSL
ncbi:flavin reductase [Enterococcus florum]|uniref:Flavin reductase n=1 Tax=Enterococcus florum TaxID=2480627 RepID=A0A4P5PQR8_9ENTE|nr:NAD(P)H-binding protein [Enterococcus florum]GCF95253.1 flavin reductase [Enterococcus florum]